MMTPEHDCYLKTCDAAGLPWKAWKKLLKRIRKTLPGVPVVQY
jgi:hypothetical protein